LLEKNKKKVERKSLKMFFKTKLKIKNEKFEKKIFKKKLKSNQRKKN